MTREEFNTTEFTASMKFKHKDGGTYPIVAIDFEEGLFGIDRYDDPEDLSWVRCESGDVES